MIKVRQITSDLSLEEIVQRVSLLHQWMSDNPGKAYWVDGNPYNFSHNNFASGSVTMSLSEIIFFEEQDYVFCKLKIGLQ